MIIKGIEEEIIERLDLSLSFSEEEIMELMYLVEKLHIHQAY